MKALLLCLSLGLFAGAALATPQQERMKTCNAEAKGMKGDEHKAHMKECLSSNKSDGATPQQNKMKTCNAEAKGKKGDEHKAFMKDCLSK